MPLYGASHIQETAVHASSAASGAVAVAASSAASGAAEFDDHCYDTARGMKRTRASPCQSAPAENSDDEYHEYCEYDEYGVQSHYARVKK